MFDYQTKRVLCGRIAKIYDGFAERCEEDAEQIFAMSRVKRKKMGDDLLATAGLVMLTGLGGGMAASHAESYREAAREYRTLGENKLKLTFTTKSSLARELQRLRAPLLEILRTYSS